VKFLKSPTGKWVTFGSMVHIFSTHRTGIPKLFQCFELEAGVANAQTQDVSDYSSQHRTVLQIDWMNKFIFDMWPFLDKVLSTFI